MQEFGFSSTCLNELEFPPNPLVARSGFALESGKGPSMDISYTVSHLADTKRNYYFSAISRSLREKIEPLYADPFCQGTHLCST